MRPRYILVTLPILLLAASAIAQEKLALLPDKPKVGESFQVLLQPAPTTPAAAGQYTWEVTVVLNEQKKNVTATAGPKTRPNAPSLTMPPLVAHAQYTVKLKIKTPMPRELTLTAESSSRGLSVTASPTDVQTATAPTPSTTPTAPAGPAETPATAPMEDDLKLTEMGERLEAAKRWAKQIVVMPKSDSLVLPITFFQEKLAKRGDGDDGITYFAHRPILDASEMHRAMMAAANQFPAETDPDRFIEAWHDHRNDFLKVLPERNAATPRIVELWKEFTEVWEQEVLKENKARFREALLQAPMIVLGLLLEFEEKHIEAAMTSGPPVGTRTGGTSTYGGGIYTHAAVHHARAMSRIHFRHQRRMAHFGY